MSSAANEYSESGAPGSEGATLSTTDNDYASRTGQSQIPVQKDDAPVEDPIDAATADSDAVLQQDDQDAIDESNILGGRTRGAKHSGGYTEPGDEEGLPADDGTSST
ncbi:MAG: hypothetical protein HETSPECPRED_009499 [Heterodermia speciosa]|uniref:Histone chaperone domain-containing protein n=1 Tax=Heterodermia speciosa TaxID=116794 RepID=A0A8H3I6Y6_9LECA|nr:MAG: hypothetical protein HETSPECPRED_009499 [Heterodermia speciosa]